MKSFRIFGISLVVAAAVAVISSGGQVLAKDNNQAEANKPKPEAVKVEKKEEPKKEELKKDSNQNLSYRYVANVGDTYAQMVRKAVQTYGIVNKVDLGQARIIAIETKVSAQNGFPHINVGQVIEFKQSDIKAWVDDAMKIQGQDLAAWQTYVPYVDFNTNHIGQ